MNVRSVTFPQLQYNESAKKSRVKKSADNGHAPEKAQAVAKQVQLAPKPNILTALDQARIHANIIFNKLNPIIGSENRHGDLCVIRSAALNILQHIEVLINAEEET